MKTAEEERVTGFLSELRIEGSSPAMVGFSEPCSYCGCKKRRCLHPPSRSRKKLLVYDPSNPSIQSLLSNSPIGRSGFTTTTPEKPEKPSPSHSSSSHSSPISLLRSFSDQIPHFLGSPAVISPDAPSPFPPAAATSFLPRDSGNITPMSPPGSDEGKLLTGGSAAPPDHLGSLHLNRSTSLVTSTTTEKILPFKEEDDDKKDGSSSSEEDEDEEGSTPEAAGEGELKTTVKCKCGAIHEFVYRCA